MPEKYYIITDQAADQIYDILWHVQNSPKAMSELLPMQMQLGDEIVDMTKLKKVINQLLNELRKD